MADELFSMDIPDLQGLIKQLDMFDERQNEALRTALDTVGDNMARAQKRHIEDTEVGKKLAGSISRSRVYTTKKGVLGVRAGYQAGAFKKDAHGFSPGMVGMTYEFGRPGTSPQRSGKTMKQMRKRIPNKKTAKRKDWEMAVPTEVDINKGTIQPHPHIRLGHDETLEQNIQTLVNAVNAEIERLNRGE